jgi:hypothetical protein
MDHIERMDRREAIKWMLAASATMTLLELPGTGADLARSGYGTDPNLMQVYKPGDMWPLTFSEEQRRTVAALCDVILPADDVSPSASQLKVPDFIDEWVSAPYPIQREDRKLILSGLEWLNAESIRRFNKAFADSSEGQKVEICDDICSMQKAAVAFEHGAAFFSKFRELAMGAYYSTPEGMKDVQYLGNVPLTKFEGPPVEVLRYLKLA